MKKYITITGRWLWLCTHEPVLQLTMVPHQYNIPWFISILSQNMTGTIDQCSHTITPPQPHGAAVAYHRKQSHTIVPYHRTIVPYHHTIAPYHRTIAPYHRTVPSHRTIAPYHRTVPSHHRSVPSHHRTVPSHHRTVPSHRTIAPLHRTIAPSHQASYVPDLFRFFQNAVTPILNLDNIYYTCLLRSYEANLTCILSVDLLIHVAFPLVCI